MEENNITVDKAVQTIKGAILRAQAQASQSSNAIQLSLYYGIGRYVSINLQQAHWGAKALDTISDRLQHELPGLRGFSSSPSGDGLKLIVAIDLQEADHATWFLALQNYIRLNYGVDIDPACKNVSRACFLPYDRHCYVNPLVCPF